MPTPTFGLHSQSWARERDDPCGYDLAEVPHMTCETSRHGQCTLTLSALTNHRKGSPVVRICAPRIRYILDHGQHCASQRFCAADCRIIFEGFEDRCRETHSGIGLHLPV